MSLICHTAVARRVPAALIEGAGATLRPGALRGVPLTLFARSSRLAAKRGDASNAKDAKREGGPSLLRALSERRLRAIASPVQTSRFSLARGPRRRRLSERKLEGDAEASV